MNKIVFCKISSMKYYKGASQKDVPYNGGSFVKKNGFGHEEYNFLTWTILPDSINDSGSIPEGEYCIGFVETKSTNSINKNQLHVEKIRGFGDAFKKELWVTGVTVIWCATTDLNETSVVGWYKNATVFREYQAFNDDRFYNVIAQSSDCVLLPESARHRHIWNVLSKKSTRTFGFGQSMLWYAQEEEALPYLDRLRDNINSYLGENWLNEYPEN